ncbi:unnamed protein product [Acanthoscelides obtectus]|uniref:Uncharacterized protein n=1 Tax=Acanthoscelides obtectus TaxID=200917 RepID=A0A9P0JUL1_ACAOB|nr:unnamed protein product [Acanthoscelides obtectus]CAK1640781.1 hypothetical protein AOBTE_LOCUS11925 [Acanthoscelides obtectus]
MQAFLTDRFNEELAVKYSNKNIIGPLNVLWTYCFIEGKDEKAEHIWNTYLKDSPRIMFQKIVHIARERQDENLAKKLIDHLKESKVTEGAIGNAYSCLLDVLVGKQKDEEVVHTFEQATKDVPINAINRTAVLRVKEIYERLGKPFTLAIPPKTTKNRSQSHVENLD